MPSEEYCPALTVVSSQYPGKLMPYHGPFAMTTDFDHDVVDHVDIIRMIPSVQHDLLSIHEFLCPQEVKQCSGL